MLEEIFLNLLRKYTREEDLISEFWNEIHKNYTAKNRHYHNLDHLKNMTTELEDVKTMVKDLDTLLFSIFYHDVIYKATKSDNEHKSAIFFKNRISQTNFQNIDKCVQQIEATKEHKLSKYSDTNILIDLDLSILGQDARTYQNYCQNIRKEYHLYPNIIYNRGRKKALVHFFNSDSIFKTTHFREKYETKAQENLIAEINQLS